MKTAEEILDILINLGYLKGHKFINKINPKHGSCCCCMTCGQFHDDCVCSHNELLNAIYD